MKLLIIAATISLAFLSTGVSAQDVGAYPGYFRFNVLQGQSDTQATTLSAKDDLPFEITEIVSPSPWIRVTHRKWDSTDNTSAGVLGKPRYRLEVTLDGTKAPIGPIAEKLRIRTTSTAQPELMIAVSGAVRPAYRVEPKAIAFGEVAFHDTAATRMISLRSNDLQNPQGFVVQKAESSLPTIVSAKLDKTDKAGEWYVTLQVLRGAPPGPFDGVIRIHTNSRYPAVVEVPIKGVVRSAQ